MSEKIYRELATKKDLQTNPMSKRYALFCKPTVDGDTGVDCFSKETHGLLGDYDDSVTVEEAAISHEHPVIIRFKALHQAKFYDH
jgi:hypothetical protein